jgi:hypothetical protein
LTLLALKLSGINNPTGMTFESSFDSACVETEWDKQSYWHDF